MRRASLPRNRNALIFAEWFGVSWAAGLIAAMLFEADTIPMTATALANRLVLNAGVTEAALAELKDAMDPGDVITDGRRWAITEGGLGECLLALDDAAQQRLAA